MAEPVLEMIRHRLDAGETEEVGLAMARRGDRTAAHLEDRLVAVADALKGAGDEKTQLLRIDTAGRIEDARPVLGDGLLNRLLGQGELADDLLAVDLTQDGVPERVIAELVAPASQILELPLSQLGLSKQIVRWVGRREHAEHGGSAEVRMPLDERLEDPERGARIHLELPVRAGGSLELAPVRVVKGEHDRSLAGRNRDTVVQQVVQSDEVVAVAVQVLQILAEVRARAGPAKLFVADLVVLQNHDLAELVRANVGEAGPGGGRRRGHGGRDGRCSRGPRRRRREARDGRCSRGRDGPGASGPGRLVGTTAEAPGTEQHGQDEHVRYEASFGLRRGDRHRQLRCERTCRALTGPLLER